MVGGKSDGNRAVLTAATLIATYFTRPHIYWLKMTDMRMTEVKVRRWKSSSALVFKRNGAKRSYFLYVIGVGLTIYEKITKNDPSSPDFITNFIMIERFNENQYRVSHY